MNIKEGDNVKYTDKAQSNIKVDSRIHTVKSIDEDGNIILKNGREVNPKWLERVEPIQRVSLIGLPSKACFERFERK
jgi:hypothetical protein